uniref:DNA-directed RNA polymerase n=1 Tax=viral metagenome TaxID=1070528 RepID=A0A6C0IJY9_9ZZZZ
MEGLVEISNSDLFKDDEDEDVKDEHEENSDIDEDDDNSEIEDSEIDEDELELDIEGASHQEEGDSNGKKKATTKASLIGGADNGEVSDEESDEDDDYLQKFNQAMRDDLILNFHPESKSHNYEEIKHLAKVTRNKNGVIVDELHKTIPLLTKYEKTRILGQRAKQLESGAVSLVQVPPNVIDSYLIAKLELTQNKIPFIIRRPLPNGGMEYWYVSDLEDL